MAGNINGLLVSADSHLVAFLVLTGTFMFSKKPELHDLIHGLERRGSICSDYSRRTLLATYDGRNFPPDSAFREIDCQDISRKGFAFYCFAKPMFSYVVVEFKGTESDIFVSGRVVRFRQLNVGKFIGLAKQ